MKLCQFQVPAGGRRVGVVDGEAVIDITAPRAGAGSVRELIVTGRTPAGIERLARRLARASRRPRHAWAALDRAPRGRGAALLAPLDPPEVRAAGITYRRSRQHYSEPDTGQAHRGKRICDYVYEAERAELFYKGSAARSVGPHGAVGLRGDSKLTVVESELAVVVGVGGGIVGYTVGNDMSAWDIERENPLFLPQSKIFQGSFAFGPVMATRTSIPDPHALTIRCVIERAGRPLFEGRASTGDLKRRCEELVDWLQRYNPVPAGTVLSTGTGILVPDDCALAPGDVVSITIDGIGTLRNSVRRLG